MISQTELRPSSAPLFALSATLLLAAILPTAASAADWPMFGQNLQNTAGTNSAVQDVSLLKVKWTFTTGGDVSARAAVVDGVAYFPDWAGNLYAVNADNGKLMWSHQLSDYGLSGTSGVVHSRTTPAVSGGTLYVGTQEGAYLLAIKAATGNLIWKTRLEPADPYAMITTSPAVSKGVVYTGVASTAEGGSAFGIDLSAAQAAAQARGSAVAVKASDGSVKWKTYMVPQGYTGGGVWGSSPVVDESRNSLFVGTGNNYTHPTDPAYVACIAGGGTAAACSSPANHVDSIVALNLTTGAIKWATKQVTWNQSGLGVADGSDDWNVDCLFFGPVLQCPSNAGPDYDFASAPNLITYGKGKTLLGAGQKSGIYYALNPDTGAELWRTQVGPGSALGGMEWGSASDGQRIYVQISNLYGIPHAFGGGNAGSWSALDPATGAVLWQVADPNGAMAIGPVAVADGVVYAPSMAGSPTAPTMLGLNAANGDVLWSFAAGSSVIAGATVVDNVVYWGSGYTHLGFPGMTGNNKFYAFSKNGK